MEARILVEPRSARQVSDDPLPSFKPGDVVMVNDEDIVKMLYKLGRIT